MLPAPAAVAGQHAFRLRIVGAGPPAPIPPGLDVEWRDWSLAREAEDFASLDVGLYPLPAGDAWAEGEAGLKAVQYMASGVPFVMSPAGSAAELGRPGSTHLLAEDAGWEAALDRLLDVARLRARMGAAGREHAVAHHSVEAAAETMAEALRAARS